MPDDEKESGTKKVVKKLKKIKKEATLQPSQDARISEPAQEAHSQPPAPPASETSRLEGIGTGPPDSDIERLPPSTSKTGGVKEAKVGGSGASLGGLKEISRPPEPQRAAAPSGPAPGPAMESPAPAAQKTLPPPPPPPEAPKAATGPGAETQSLDSRIGSIDIDKLTSELEQDILNTLTNEIGEILSTANPPPKERKEVRDDHAAATSQPPRPPPPRPPEQAVPDRSMESEQRERRVAYRLGREFDKLPVNMRNELIKTLARTDDVKVREDVVIACASNFDKLPPEVRALLRTLANDRDSRVREEVAFELNRNFSKITTEYRNELIPLLSRDVDVKVREDIVAAIASHYDRHPPEVQELMRTLATDRKPSVRDQVMHEALRNADRIPEGVRTELNHLLEKTGIESRERE